MYGKNRITRGLKRKKLLIKMAVEEKGIPFLGLCLGHQLLAESLGGVVGKSETAEVGVMEVQLTEDGATGILFDGIPEKYPASNGMVLK